LELAKRLKKHGLPGETQDSIKAKLKRGTFAATFLDEFGWKTAVDRPPFEGSNDGSLAPGASAR
jgi:hypothetical protein